MAGGIDPPRRVALRRGLLAAWALALTWLTLTPRPPHVPLGGFDHADKVGHFVSWLVLAALLETALRARALAVSVAHPARSAWILSVAYGTAVELAQAAIPGRSAEWLDLAADALGAWVGAYGLARWEERNGW